MKQIYSWSFNDTNDKSSIWYITAFSIVIWLVVWWVFTKQYWLVLISLLLPGVYFLVENNSPDVIWVVFTDFWVQVATNFYEYKSIETFSFIYEKGIPVSIRLQLKSRFISFIDLKVDENIATDLRQFLPNYITEDENFKLSFADKIISFFKL